MAWIVGDGFDYYKDVNALKRSVWDIVTEDINNPIYFDVGRFGGQALRTLGNVTTRRHVQKNFTPAASTIFVNLAMYFNYSLVGGGVVAVGVATIADGLTSQVTIIWQNNGDILVRRGDWNTGTLILTGAGAFISNTWAHFQIKVVIHPTNGSVEIRKNGSATNTWSVTGVNTQATGNTQATMFAYGADFGPSFSAITVDDMLVYSGAGAAPNDWVGDVRAMLLTPHADTAMAAWIPYPSTTLVFGPATSSTGTVPANRLTCCGPYKPTRSGVLTKLTIQTNVTYTGKLRLAIYLDDGASGPGTLLVVSNEVVNPGAAATIDVVIPGTASVDSGRFYWFAFFQDAALTNGWRCQSAGSKYVDLPYTGGFPDPMPDALTVQTGQQPWANATYTGHCTVVSEQIGNEDVDYLYSATVGAEDRYVLSDAPPSAFQVIGVTSKMLARKSDPGARTIQLVLASGAVVQTTDALLSSTYQHHYRVDAVDPATGVPWTRAGLNALQLGCKVV
jgi:hypothetical protein